MELVELVFLDPELRNEPLGAGRRVGRGLTAEGRAALRDRAVKKTLGGGHRHDRGRFAATARLAEDRDSIGIAAEVLDVVTDPPERRDEVLNADVRRLRPLLAAEVGEVQKAEDVQTMIDRDDDHVFLLREVRAVVEQVVARTGREPAAVHPDHDGARGIVEAGREHVHGQAVFALRGVAVERRHDGRRLLGIGRNGRSEGNLEVILDARPRRGLLRRHEAIGAAGRRAVRDAPELMDALLEQTAHTAGLSLGNAADRREAPILRQHAERRDTEGQTRRSQRAGAQEKTAVELRPGRNAFGSHGFPLRASHEFARGQHYTTPSRR